MMMRRFLRSASARFRRWPPQPLILIYHRVAVVPVDPWGLAVSPKHFAEHLDVLRRTRHPMPLATFVSRITERTLPRNAVAVTFDDGYADNLLAARPCLDTADVSATVFLATGLLGRAACWWDELATLLLLANGSRRTKLALAGQTLELDLGAESQAAGASGWRAWSDPLTGRQAAYLAIWRALRPLDDAERDGVMAELRSKLTHNADSSAGRMMTHEEARTLAADGLVAIGAHSVTHPALASLVPAARNREIAESKAACEALIGAPIAAFAYPYGDLDSEVRSAVESAGFGYACTTELAPVAAGCDLLALPRIQVLDWDGEVFDEMLRAPTDQRRLHS